MRGKPSDEEFMKIWKSCKTVKEVSEKTGLTPNAVRVRAFYYRRRGEDLRQLLSGNRRDVKRPK